MIVYVFGNPDVSEDALPIRLVPLLRKACPSITFEVKNPNEEWEVPERLVVIDTVVGIDHIHEFHGLDDFARAPRVSMHDFDALTQLRLLQKLGRIKKVSIIGVPPDIEEHQALEAVVALLEKVGIVKPNRS